MYEHARCLQVREEGTLESLLEDKSADIWPMTREETKGFTVSALRGGCERFELRFQILATSSLSDINSYKSVVNARYEGYFSSRA